jgi:2-desacetyl-2-hydroxyethyl bacteriochlorophyllide A dehydrogenase
VRALKVLKPNNIELIEEIDPKIEPNQSLVFPIAVGICGTDLAIIKGKIDPAFIKYPITLGHEWVGRTANGDRVVVEGIIPCEKCSQCLSKNTNRCEIYDEIGFTKNGAIADKISVPTNLIHKIDNNVSDETASLVEPAAVVTQGLIKVLPNKGIKVLVIGEGTIGLLAAKIIRSFEPIMVYMLGLKESQKDLVLKNGIDKYFTNPSDINEKFDLVIECSGAMSAIQSGFKLSARGAKILLLGYTENSTPFELQIDDLINNDQCIYASFGYTRTAWFEVVNKINQNLLDFTSVVTHQFDIEQWQEAITVMEDRDQVRGKVLIRVIKGQ